MSSDTLIAPSDGTSATAGSGWASDLTNIYSDLQAKNAGWESVVDGTLAGIDVLSSVANPLGGLIANGVGWLIEHIPGISDVWDKLMGNSAKIEQLVATWDNISRSLNTTAGTYGTATGQIEQWSGQAADSYRQVATGYESALSACSVNAEGLSVVIELLGGIISGLKDVVYNLIAEFVEFTVLPAILGALATAWCTFGGSVAAAITFIEVEADVTAGQIAIKITEVTEKIVVVSERGAKVIAETEKLTKDLEELEKSIDKGTKAARIGKDLAVGTGAGEVEGTRGRAKRADGNGE